MPKLPITQEFVKRLAPPTTKAKEQYFDTELNGFMIEVKATGAKTYYYRYRTDGKQKMQRIGSANELTLNDAHKSYYELKEQQANQPIAQESPEPTINPITFEQFYTNHYLSYIKTHIKSHETNISVFKNHILSHLANTPMKDLKKTQVMSYHSSSNPPQFLDQV